MAQELRLYNESPQVWGNFLPCKSKTALAHIRKKKCRLSKGRRCPRLDTHSTVCPLRRTLLMETARHQQFGSISCSARKDRRKLWPAKPDPKRSPAPAQCILIHAPPMPIARASCDEPVWPYFARPLSVRYTFRSCSPQIPVRTPTVRQRLTRTTISACSNAPADSAQIVHVTHCRCNRTYGSSMNGTRIKTI